MADRLRVLFVWPGAEYSIFDVGQGYRDALVRAGHDVRDYIVTARMRYHSVAMEAGGLDMAEPESLNHLTKQACENVIVEAAYHRADLVVVCCGLNFHPIGLRLLRQFKIQTAIILTESPYEDIDQAAFVAHYPEAIVTTNDNWSARQFGWMFAPPSFEPTRHRPVTPKDADRCDVLFVGTGWPERQALFDAIDWTGIDVRFKGPFPYMRDDSPIKVHHEDVCVPNARLVELYSAAKICLNFQRASAVAETPGPRTFELAACGAFQVSDSRMGGFDGDVPTFDSPESLQALLQYYLEHEDERRTLAEKQHARVMSDMAFTFDARVRDLLAVAAIRRIAAAR